MAQPSKPEKPLKILTIDGGGLQGISSLLILDKLLSAIARNNGVEGSKPRPCDVFDVIAGIGAGGWLALLLGRFQMDVASAYAEWIHLIDCITPNSKAKEIYMRLTKHCYYDSDRLVEQIEQLAHFYETNETMFFYPPEGSRCKHVFVSALKIDKKDRHLGYHLFRTYKTPQNADVLEGPQDPHKCRISHAFGATGAAKYFTPPWRDTSKQKGRLRFLDTMFPSPHNITDLALDEMWGLYGTNVEISVVVNIGPGTPNKDDCKIIARRFSWGLTPAATSGARSQKSSLRNSIATADPEGSLTDRDETSRMQKPKALPLAEDSIKFDQNIPVQAGKADTKKLMPHPSTFGSEHHVSIEKKLSRNEDEFQDHVREKLRNIYPDNTPPYYRLAPEQSAPGAIQNDTTSPRVSFDATQQYLRDRKVEAIIEEVGRRTPYQVPVEPPVDIHSDNLDPRVSIETPQSTDKRVDEAGGNEQNTQLGRGSDTMHLEIGSDTTQIGSLSSRTSSEGLTADKGFPLKANPRFDAISSKFDSDRRLDVPFMLAGMLCFDNINGGTKSELDLWWEETGA